MKKLLVFGGFFIIPIIAFKDFDYKKAFKLKFFNKTENKDETRFNTNYYGLSWGAKTDEIIETKLETGDLVLIKKQSFLSKYFVRSSTDYDNIGLLFRTVTSILIILIEKGELRIIPYSEFLTENSNNSYIKIKLKDNEFNRIQVKKSLLFIEKLKNLNNKYKSSSDMVNDYFTTVGLCKRKSNDSVIDRDYPLCLNLERNFGYSSELVVRSTLKT